MLVILNLVLRDSRDQQQQQMLRLQSLLLLRRLWKTDFSARSSERPPVRWQRCSPSASRLARYPRPELLGRGFETLKNHGWCARDEFTQIHSVSLDFGPRLWNSESRTMRRGLSSHCKLARRLRDYLDKGAIPCFREPQNKDSRSLNILFNARA